MPTFKTAADVLKFKQSYTRRKLQRIPQYRQITDGKMKSLDALRTLMSDDFKKMYVPFQTGIVAQVLYDMTNIMSSNQSEIRFRARSTDPKIIADVQDHEHGHEALDPILFPLSVRRRMYAFLVDSYVVVALDVTPTAGLLAGFADRKKLRDYAEDDESSDEGMSAEAMYKRAYGRTSESKTTTERHEDAYTKSTTEAKLADGCNLHVRVIDLETFRGAQVDGDPARFAIGLEYGQKQLNPLLAAMDDFGVRKGKDGILYIDADSKDKDSPSYQALLAGTIAESPTNAYNRSSGDEYAEYTQLRTCEETIILVEHPKGKKGKDGEPGILIRTPNLFGGAVTGYYLIEGDVKLRSGELEDRYDPPLRHLMNEAQHYNYVRTAYEAISMSEAARGLYQYIENDASGAIEPHDPTQETKSAATEDGTPVPIAAGEIKRAEGFGHPIEAMLQHSLEQLHEARPTDVWGGTGASSETGIAIARRETALLTKLTPYQTSISEVCKRIHQDTDRYVEETGESIELAYLPPEATADSKPEVRKITPQSAVLPMDMDYTIGSDTPESKAGREQMSAQRYALGVYGMSDHREEIGIKDPNAAEERLTVDRLMTMFLGEKGQPGILDEVFRPAAMEYSKAAIERELGPIPEPPPQLVGPNGQPISSGQPPGPPPQGMTPQGVGPETVAPPQGALQTLPQVGGIPVTAGGPPGVG